MTDDLLAWLRDQLDDDELSARAVLGADAASWDPYGYLPGEKRDYLTRFDPARVLAEVDADRRILDLYEQTEFGDFARRTALEDVIRLRALRYADHPDYRNEWRP